MKVVRVLSRADTRTLTDLLNQMILRELVLSERSVSGLARKLNLPTLKLWRRVQKLESLGLIEVSRTEKSGNIETKLYRSAAASFVPEEFLDLVPKDRRLAQASAIYTKLHKRMTGLISAANEIPPGADPVDYSFFATLSAFAAACGGPEGQEMISALRDKLSEYKVPLALSKEARASMPPKPASELE